jgi:hypothetical protein
MLSQAVGLRVLVQKLKGILPRRPLFFHGHAPFSLIIYHGFRRVVKSKGSRKRKEAFILSALDFCRGSHERRLPTISIVAYFLVQ